MSSRNPERIRLPNVSTLVCGLHIVLYGKVVKQVCDVPGQTLSSPGSLGHGAVDAAGGLFGLVGLGFRIKTCG